MKKYQQIVMALVCFVSVTRPLSAQESALTPLNLPPSLKYNPDYHDTALQLSLPAAAILATTGLSALVLHKALQEDDGSNSTAVLSPQLDEQISQVGEALAFSIPVGFLMSLQFMSRNQPQRQQAVRVTSELFSTLALTVATSYAVKSAELRERPNGEDAYSFPSAHSAETFACATVLALNYPWYVGAPSLMAASLVGFARYDMGVHYLTDVVAGAGIGIFYATMSHWAHRRLQPTSGLSKKTSLFMPLAAVDTYGLAWRLSL